MLSKVSARFMLKFFVGSYEMCGVQRFSDQRAYAFLDERYCFSGQAMHACQFSVPVWHCQLTSFASVTDLTRFEYFQEPHNKLEPIIMPRRVVTNHPF